MATFEEVMEAHKDRIYEEKMLSGDLVDMLNGIIRRVRQDIHDHGGQSETSIKPTYRDRAALAEVSVVFPEGYERFDRGGIGMRLIRTEPGEYVLTAGNAHGTISNQDEGAALVFEGMKPKPV